MDHEQLAIDAAKDRARYDSRRPWTNIVVFIVMVGVIAWALGALAGN